MTIRRRFPIFCMTDTPNSVFVRSTPSLAIDDCSRASWGFSVPASPELGDSSRRPVLFWRGSEIPSPEPFALVDAEPQCINYFIVIEINSFRHSIGQLPAQASENVGTRCLPIMRVTEPSGLQYGVEIT